MGRRGSAVLFFRVASVAERSLTGGLPQIEYLVVTYSKDSPHVLLSLRQADILDALDANKGSLAKRSCVPEYEGAAGSR